VGSVEELFLILISGAGRLGLVTYQAPGGCHLVLQLPVQSVEDVAFSDRHCYRTILYAGQSCQDVFAQDCRLGKDLLSCGNRLLGTEFSVRALRAGRYRWFVALFGGGGRVQDAAEEGERASARSPPDGCC
jgi:hypothetical protein